MCSMWNKLRHRWDVWEIAVAVCCLILVARFGPIPGVGGQFFTDWQIQLGSLVEEYCKLSYLFGYLILSGLTVLSYARYHAYLFENMVLKYIATAGVLFWGLLLLDWWWSPADPYPYEKAWPVLYYGILWHLAFLFIRPESASRLIKFAIICASIAALYGVVYYLTGFRYLTLQGFGRRASGPHHTIELYTICLISFPFSAALAWASVSKWLRFLYSMSACVIFAGLIFTYTRGGWLALSGVCIILLLHRPAFLSKRAFYGILTLSILLIIGTLFFRTRGSLIGSPADRSFHGRLAIWKTALKVFEAHPLIGNGLTNYKQAQAQHMTYELASFHPGNPEPKNILLSILCEQGMVTGITFGILMTLLVVSYYTRVYRLSMMKLTSLSSPSELVMGGYLSLIALLLAGIVDTPVLHYSRPSATILFIVLTTCSMKVAYEHFNIADPSQVNFAEEVRRLRQLLIAILAAVAVLAVPTLSGVYIYLKNRQVIHPLAFRDSKYPISKIPRTIRDCVIASEDGYFFQHHGVDWQALHRALRVNIRNLRFKQGGSTITMQTARCLLLGRRKTLPRKVAEILLALEMERHLSKERILELYLNSARFGLGAEDIGTACAVYFGKKPSELTLAEAGFLAGVLPEPPRTREELTPEKVERCKRRALDRLAYFFPAEYSPLQIEQALRERITFVWQKGGSL